MGGARRQRGRQAGILIAGLAVGAIAVLTLRPGPDYLPSPPPGCIICGEYGAADAILNVLLFVPLGLGLGLMGMRSGRALLGGMFLSLLIESWQIILPGRDASLGDLITNSTGALLGAVLARHGRILVTPSPRQSRWLHAAWAAGVLVGIASFGMLFSPSLPRSVWYSQWTPELGQFATYTGKVLRAGIDGVPLPPGRIRPAARIRDSLPGGALVTVRFTLGSAPPSLAPVLSFFDEEQREIFLVGASGDDLIIRYRSRAADLKLDTPDMVAANALAGVQLGDTITLGIRWKHPRFEIDVNGNADLVGPDLAQVPAMLLRPQHLLWHGKGPMPVIWLASVFFPLGYWASRWPHHAASGALLAATAALPLVAPLLPAPTGLLVAGLGGAAAGIGTRRIVATVQQRRESEAAF